MMKFKTPYRWVVGIILVFVLFVILNYRVTIPLTHFFNSSENSFADALGCTMAPQCTTTTALLNKLSDLENVRKENEELRQQLKFFKRLSYDQIISNVKSHDPLNQALMYIDAGAKDGVRVGQAVTSNDGIMVGKVSQVTDDSALVELLTNDSTRLTVQIVNGSQAQGLLQGRLGSAIRMGYVQTADNLAIGDIVMTSGIEGTIPRGLIIGSIAKIDIDQNQLFTNADISPALDYNQIRTVAVIRLQ